MCDDAAEGVVIGEGQCRLSLTCLGTANEIGVPTLIDVQAGAFAGSIRDDTVGDYAVFAKQLEDLHRSLSGMAVLGSHEGFRLALTGDGRGNVSGSAVLIADHVAPIRLEFGFALDQSYLPSIIRALHREFPSSARGHR